MWSFCGAPGTAALAPGHGYILHILHSWKHCQAAKLAKTFVLTLMITQLLDRANTCFIENQE